MSSKVIRGVKVSSEKDVLKHLHALACPVEGFGMSGADVTDTHRPTPYGATHYFEPMEGSVEFKFEFPRKVELDEMWVWNYNCPGDNYRHLWWHGGSAVGVRDARLYTSLDGSIWNELDNGGEPFRFARNDGEDKCQPASNLDGTGEPVKFKGVKVRYVKIVPVPERYVGNWGAEIIG